MLKSIELPTLAVVRRSAGEPTSSESLASRLGALLDSPDLDTTLNQEVGLEERLIHLARDLGGAAYPDGKTTDRRSAPWIDHAARSDFHRALLVLYQQHVQIAPTGRNTYQFHPFVCRMMQELERPWERELLRRARRDAALTAEDLPADPTAFAQWYQ